MKILYFSTIGFFLSLFLSCKSQEKEVWNVYYFGGQSNMDGYGYNSELPDSLDGIISNAMIFDGNRDNEGSPNGGVGIWSPVEPGHGYGFKTNGKSNDLSERFGPELSFANSLVEQGKKVAIIKYSFGGTSLFQGAGYGNWDPDQEGINHYDNALATIKNAFDIHDINYDGKLDKLIPSGIIWMQGESDAEHSQESADAYLTNLNRLMDLLRAAMRKKDLPVIIGKINDSQMYDDGAPTQPYISTVHLAQETFTKTDPCAGYVKDIESYNFLPDAWHYDTDGFIKMGQAFARVALELELHCK